MADRSWFYASEGQQNGPFSESQFRELIAQGVVRSDTDVWANGMSEWARAGDIPGLIRNAAGQRGQSAMRAGSSSPGNGLSYDAASGDAVQGLELTLGRLLRIYWTFVWRASLGGFVIGAVLGFVAGFVLGLFGASIGHIKSVAGGLGGIGGLLWSIVCLKMVLAKKYRDFRIVLVPHERDR